MAGQYNTGNSHRSNFPNAIMGLVVDNLLVECQSIIFSNTGELMTATIREVEKGPGGR